MSLRIKTQYEFQAYMSAGGYLCIKQKDIESGKEACLLLTPEQYESLDNFVLANLKDFIERWNKGVNVGESE